MKSISPASTWVSCPGWCWCRCWPPWRSPPPRTWTLWTPSPRPMSPALSGGLPSLFHHWFIAYSTISRCKDKPAVMESLSETQGSILQYICEVSCPELLSSWLLPMSTAGIVWARGSPRGSHNRNLPQQNEPDNWVGDCSDRWERSLHTLC